MNPFADPKPSASCPPPPRKKFLILHDTIHAGVRARRLASRIAQASRGTDEAQVSIWLHDSLVAAQCAVAAWMEADTSEAVILSLSAGRELSDAARVWLEAWLNHAGGGRARLIVMWECSEGEERARAQAKMKYFFERLTHLHGVDFLWHPVPEAKEEETSPACSSCRVEERARFHPRQGIFTRAAASAE